MVPGVLCVAYWESACPRGCLDEVNGVSRSQRVALGPITKAWSCQVRYISTTKVSRNNNTSYEIVEHLDSRMLNIAVPGFVCSCVLSIGQGCVMIADKLLLTALVLPAALCPSFCP